MTNLYRPNEAKEDVLVQRVVIAVIVMAGAAFFAHATMHSGLKYLVLKASGIETEAQVLSIIPYPIDRSDPRLISLNTNYREPLVDVLIAYRDHKNEQFETSFLALEERNEVKERDRIPVTFSRWRSDVFLPTQVLQTYRIDAWIVSIATLLMAAGVVTIVLSIRRWRALRAKPRRSGQP